MRHALTCVLPPLPSFAQVIYLANTVTNCGNIHTNTIEGYFSIFKRGMKGIYQHCAKRHLHRYMAEYDFRYSNPEF